MDLIFIMFIFMVMMIIQWIHPLAVCFIYRLFFTRRIIFHFVTGIVLTLLTVGSLVLYYLDDSFMQIYHSYVLASAIIFGIVNNVSFSINVSKSIDCENELKVDRALKITAVGSIIFLLVVSINYLIANDSEILFSYLVFDGKNPIFYTLSINLLLFALAFIIVYIYIVYIIFIFKRKQNLETSKIISNIKNLINAKNIGIISLIGLFVCYFYLASIYPPGTVYRTTFQNTLSVFHLLTASILIPLVLDKFINKRG